MDFKFKNQLIISQETHLGKQHGSTPRQHGNGARGPADTASLPERSFETTAQDAGKLPSPSWVSRRKYKDNHNQNDFSRPPSLPPHLKHQRGCLILGLNSHFTYKEIVPVAGQGRYLFTKLSGLSQEERKTPGR